MGGEERSFKNQNMILENRKRLSVSGVEEVDGFDDSYVNIRTGLGTLVVRGHELHVESLSVETGELLITGEIGEMIYEEASVRTGWIKRLLG